jgi:hypothetical protein
MRTGLVSAYNLAVNLAVYREHSVIEGIRGAKFHGSRGIDKNCHGVGVILALIPRELQLGLGPSVMARPGCGGSVHGLHNFSVQF